MIKPQNNSKVPLMKGRSWEKAPELFRPAVLRHSFLAMSLLGFAWVAMAPSVLADIPEPDTIFYGRIVNRSSGQEDLLAQGNLSWIVRRPDGQQITLSAKVKPLNNGLYSYSLLVPHQALAFGLTVSSNVVPLALQSAVCSHVQISVDGSPASILAPGTSSFSVSQATRSTTYRLDLEVFSPLADTTGDGIPDWWKAKYGVIDPNADPDGDGWSNLQEFLHGGNPTNDNRTPTLATTESYVYAGGTTGIRLQAVDSDSAATNLFYTLLAAPQTGTLSLRNASTNPASSDGVLVAGSTFTQDDVNNGRLIFRHQSGDPSITADNLQVSLHDETATHPWATNLVALNLYLPGYSTTIMQQAQSVAVAPAAFTDIAGLSFYEQQMLLNYFLSRDHSYIIWDGSRASAPQEIRVPSSGLSQAQYTQYIATYGHDRSYVLMAGAGGDHLVGGMEGDIIIGGRGVDSMRGNGGSDLFVIADSNGDNDTIEDFNVNEHDAIDISRVLLGSSIWLTNYVQITKSGTNSYLNINFNGDGANYTNMIVTLQGVQFTQDDLRSLVENGNIITGGKALPPRFSIVASVPAASQNGPVPGQFTITRSVASSSMPLTANLQITGSAVNGNDYQYIPTQVNFSAGQSSVTILVNPYPTTSVLTQFVQVTIISGAGYEVGSPAQAQISIAPLLPQITIQAIEPLASRIDQTAGLFLVSRGGIVNNSVLVRLTIGGTAPASHYNSISPFLNLTPNQTTALISVTPKPTAVLSNGLESVQISIKPDPSYSVMSPSTDRVLLIDQIMTLGLWQQRYFATNNDPADAFALEDPTSTGIRNLFRYAFGLSPLAPQNSGTRLPYYQILNDHLAVSYKQPPAISDLSYVVEVSEDLINWRSTTNDLEQYFPAASSNDFETMFFRSKEAVSQTEKQFMRVRVQLQ